MDFFNKLAEQFIRMNRRLQKWQRVVSALAAVVVFITTYALVLPAITLDKETASTQAGIEIAASENDPESEGTVYEAEPEELSEEPQEEAEEPQETEAVTEDSGSENGSQEAEEDSIDEDSESDNGQGKEEQTGNEGSSDAEDAGPDTDEHDASTAETLPEDEIAEEIPLITEETQLTYEYIDEAYEDGIDDENDDGIDDGYIVYAEFGADAKLPEGVELQAEEITKESDPELYEAYYEKALSGLQDKYDENTALSFARFYDIRFVYNGEEVEPSGDVKVRIEYKKAVEIEKETNVDAVHFDKNNDEEPEVIESEVETEKKGKDDTVKTVEFESAQFSVYGIIGSYTVDFHWEVDGKSYEFRMPGGGFISFEALIEVLNVAGADHADSEAVSDSEEQPAVKLTLDDISISEETRKFVADVTDVEFSSPDLVWVRKIDSDSTVGALKEANSLECQYSAELTEEEIAEINAQMVQAGDWALIGMRPFSSEEMLTVTMKTGERFVIKVTDEMDSTTPYSQGTTFTAYDTRPDGFTINLFDYGPESVLDHGSNNILDRGDQLNQGINYGHDLKFTAYGKKPSEVQTSGRNVLSMNHFSGTEAATQGIVDRNLSGGFPKLNGGESLAYLFNTTPSGDNKRVYENVSGLFQKDADGKYYYDSNVNYAYYNPSQGNGGNFELCDTFPEEGSDWGVGFFPFSPWNGSNTCIHWNGYCPPRGGSNANAGWGSDGKYHSAYYYNHHFGMTLEGSFQLTPDGKLNDKDLVFNFSGDDDLWVYIDDVLVLDIGGIHNPVGGSINFRTGEVSVDSAYQVNSVINDSQSGPEANTTIAQAFAAAGKTWNNEPYAEHTIKVFYVERGGCYSNCRMEFNLTRFKDVEFDKEDQYGDPIENAEFRLFKEDGTPLIETYIDHDDNDTVKYREYVRYSDENGHIKFDHVPVGTYYVRETTVPEGYIADEATYTAKVEVIRNDDGTYSLRSYVLRNGEQTENVLNTKQEDINLSLVKKWKIGDTEVDPASASASFQLMRVRIVEESHTEPGTKIPAVVKLQDKNGTSLCSELSIHAGDTIKISGYRLSLGWGVSEAIDDVKLGSKTVGQLRTWSTGWNQSSSEDVTYTVSEADITNGEVVLRLNSKTTNDFSTRPVLSIESEGPDPDPVTVIEESTVTEAVETFDLPDGGSWSKSFTKPLYDELGKKYTYYFIETSNSEGTAPVYVDGNGQVISDPADLAADEDTTQTIINNVVNGFIEITKNLQKNGEEAGSLTGTFYYAVYAEADVEDGVPKADAQAVRTGSITVGEDDNGTQTVTIRVPLGTYYVYELTGEGGEPIVETSRQRIGERTYQVTGSGTVTEVGVTDGSAVLTNNYETVEKTATKSWSDNEDHPTIYFKLFYISRGQETEDGAAIEFVEVEGAEIKELASGTTSVTWEDLPKYDANGEEYIYIVKEYIKVNGEYIAAAPDGYVKSENGLNVNNTKSEGYDPKTTYVGTKTWEDAVNNGATRPDSIHVDLYANGVKLENCTAQWTKGTGDAANVWTYTFSDLPIFDENGVYIRYTAVETPVPGYTEGPTTQQQTTYQMITDPFSLDGNIDRVTTCSDLDITLAEETDLAFVVIKKSANRHLIWTQRAISRDEKNRIYEDINKVSGFRGELSDSTVEFVSGVPIETEFFKGTVTVSKTSDKVMHVEFANHETWAQLCYGSYKYTYDPGRTDFINSLNTTEADAVKAWTDSDGQPMTPVEGTTVTFDLYADGVQQNKPVVLNGKVDVSELSEDTEEAEAQELNPDAVAANAYEKEAWKAYWGDLPTHSAAGEEITYTVKETAVPGFENMDPDGVASGGTITNKQIVTQIHILKKRPDGQPLTGAKFRLDQYDAERKTVIKTWGPEEVSSEQGKEGTLTFEGLSIGKYTLVETKRPDGYIKTGDDPEFEVIQNEDGTLQVQFTNTEEVTYDAESGTFHVINTPGAFLPNAGGPGTKVFTIFGTFLIAGAGLLLWRRRRLI